MSVINNKQSRSYGVSTNGISITGETKVYPDIQSMKSDKRHGRFAWVKDASADSTVNKGAAFYTYDAATGWVKLYEVESMDYDTANSTHTHANMDLLNGLSIDEHNHLYFNGEQISSNDQINWNASANQPGYVANKPTSIKIVGENGNVLAAAVPLDTGGEKILVIQNIPMSMVSGLAARLNSMSSMHATDIATLTNRLATNETQHQHDINSINQHIDTLSTDHDNDITALRNVMTLADNELNAKINNIQDQLDALPEPTEGCTCGEKIERLTNRVSLVEQTVANLDIPEPCTCSDAIATLSGRVVNLEDRIDNLPTGNTCTCGEAFDIMRQTIAAVSGSVTTVSGQVVTLSGTVNTISAIASAASRVGHDAQLSCAALFTSVGDNRADINRNYNTLVAHGSRIEQDITPALAALSAADTAISRVATAASNAANNALTIANAASTVALNARDSAAAAYNTATEAKASAADAYSIASAASRQAFIVNAGSIATNYATITAVSAAVTELTNSVCEILQRILN